MTGLLILAENCMGLYVVFIPTPVRNGLFLFTQEKRHYAGGSYYESSTELRYKQNILFERQPTAIYIYCQY
jgi:hypothetical protein